MNRRRPLVSAIRTILSVGWLAAALPAHADLAVIVNPLSGVEQLSKAQVVNIFLGSHREFPTGIAAKPVDLGGALPEKAQFYRGLVNRDLDQMAAYWSRLVFSGSTVPPVQANNWQDVLQLVATNRNAIGYIDSKNADPARVRIVFTIP